MYGIELGQAGGVTVHATGHGAAVEVAGVVRLLGDRERDQLVRLLDQTRPDASPFCAGTGSLAGRGAF